MPVIMAPMTPSEADQRIVLSRRTLHRYREMIEHGLKPEADLPIMEQEIGVLRDIAEHHPSKLGKVAALVRDWQEVIGRIRTVH